MDVSPQFALICSVIALAVSIIAVAFGPSSRPSQPSQSRKKGKANG